MLSLATLLKKTYAVRAKWVMSLLLPTPFPVEATPSKIQMLSLSMNALMLRHQKWRTTIRTFLRS